jgi:hypothetical protein
VGDTVAFLIEEHKKSISEEIRQRKRSERDAKGASKKSENTEPMRISPTTPVWTRMGNLVKK